mgnify:FL=1
MELIIVLTALFSKHILADYFFQRAWMFPDKGVYGAWGGVAHAITHSILTSFVLMFFTDVFTAQALAVLDGFLHYHIDYIKNNVWKSKKYTASHSEYWMIHGVDQFLHFLTYVLIVFLISNH